MKNNIPPIAEKVKFWEEQDKINQAILPRIIEMNESIKDLAKQIGEVDNKIASSESRVLKKVRKEFNTSESYRILMLIAIGISIISILIAFLK